MEPRLPEEERRQVRQMVEEIAATIPPNEANPTRAPSTTPRRSSAISSPRRHISKVSPLSSQRLLSRSARSSFPSSLRPLSRPASSYIATPSSSLRRSSPLSTPQTPSASSALAHHTGGSAPRLLSSSLSAVRQSGSSVPRLLSSSLSAARQSGSSVPRLLSSSLSAARQSGNSEAGSSKQALHRTTDLTEIEDDSTDDDSELAGYRAGVLATTLFHTVYLFHEVSKPYYRIGKPRSHA